MPKSRRNLNNMKNQENISHQELMSPTVMIPDYGKADGSWDSEFKIITSNVFKKLKEALTTERWSRNHKQETE